MLGRTSILPPNSPLISHASTLTNDSAPPPSPSQSSVCALPLHHLPDNIILHIFDTLATLASTPADTPDPLDTRVFPPQHEATRGAWFLAATCARFYALYRAAHVRELSITAFVRPPDEAQAQRHLVRGALRRFPNVHTIRVRDPCCFHAGRFTQQGYIHVKEFQGDSSDDDGVGDSAGDVQDDEDLLWREYWIVPGRREDIDFATDLVTTTVIEEITVGLGRGEERRQRLARIKSLVFEATVDDRLQPLIHSFWDEEQQDSVSVPLPHAWFRAFNRVESICSPDMCFSAPVLRAIPKSPFLYIKRTTLHTETLLNQETMDLLASRLEALEELHFTCDGWILEYLCINTEAAMLLSRLPRLRTLSIECYSVGAAFLETIPSFVKEVTIAVPAVAGQELQILDPAQWELVMRRKYMDSTLDCSIFSWTVLRRDR